MKISNADKAKLKCGFPDKHSYYWKQRVALWWIYVLVPIIFFSSIAAHYIHKYTIQDRIVTESFVIVKENKSTCKCPGESR